MFEYSDMTGQWLIMIYFAFSLSSLLTRGRDVKLFSQNHLHLFKTKGIITSVCPLSKI